VLSVVSVFPWFSLNNSGAKRCKVAWTGK
jgi:hypothetical protein